VAFFCYNDLMLAVRKVFIIFCFALAAFSSFFVGSTVLAVAIEEATVSGEPVAPPAKPILTEESEETLGPFESLLEEQKIGSAWPMNPVKYAIRGAVEAGVPANTIVLLLLIPVVASVIAAARHLIGIRGFGIFLPAALSVVFVSIGPIVGISLFLIIIFVSTLARIFLRKAKFRLQYLPKMALLLWFVVVAVLGILFAAPIIKITGLTNVSIFPVLILVLLAEDFAKVQTGKSVGTAINLTMETLILSLVSYGFLTHQPLQQFALLKPEILLMVVAVFDVLLGRYVGLRFLEFWRFRKLISG
jgi:hypothetical protein